MNPTKEQMDKEQQYFDKIKHLIDSEQRKLIDEAIFNLEEIAFRRGYCHGYEVGIRTQPDEMVKKAEAIDDWRHNAPRFQRPPGFNFKIEEDEVKKD